MFQWVIDVLRAWISAGKTGSVEVHFKDGRVAGLSIRESISPP